MKSRRIFVAGIPRSGTTWVAKVLSAAPGITYIHEPDNERHNLLGYIYKRRLPRFPYLAKQDENNEFASLYRHAFSGRYLETNSLTDKVIKKLTGFDRSRVERRINANIERTRIDISPENFEPAYGTARLLQALSGRIKSLFTPPAILVKSVHSVLALEFIDRHFDPDLLVIFRHPANVINSYLTLGLNDRWRNIFSQEKLIDDYLSAYMDKVETLDDSLERVAAQVGAFYYVLERQLRENPEWTSVRHEQLCVDPKVEFKKLYTEMGLKWTPEIADYIDRLNTEGEGYAVRRITGDQIDKWKRNLNRSEVEKIARGFTIFDHRYEYNFEL